MEFKTAFKKYLKCKIQLEELKLRIMYIRSLKPHSDEWCDEVSNLLKCVSK